MKAITRGAAFLGALLLLYTMAAGLSLGSAAGSATESALRQHTIVGILGTVLCIASIVVLLRRNE